MIHDIRVISKGLIDVSSKGKTIVVKGFTEEELIQLKHMINEEVRRQKNE